MAKNSVFLLLLSVCFLIGLGLVMLYSTGAYARGINNDTLLFLKQQCKWLAIGVIACAAAAFIDYHLLARFWYVFFALAFVLLALCFVPHIGLFLNGSYRWIRLGPITFQPSEIAKVAAVISLAWWFTKFEQQSSHFWRGFIWPMGIVGTLMLLIVREEDLGTTMLICTTMVAVMFIAGSNTFYMLLLGAPVLAEFS